jgi:hypothetical protein
MTSLVAPSRLVRDRAASENLRVGHENVGFLSVAHGLMPIAEPRLRLPASHRAWDDLAAELPELHRRLAVRRALDTLPMLPASTVALADADLLRAAAILGILAHAYWWSDPVPPARLPAGLAVPWRVVNHRLARPGANLSYVDIVVYNWRLVDPSAAEPRRVENMRLLIPTVGNEAEHVFYLTQAEILARCTPIVDAVVEAQTATLADDPAGLTAALVEIAEVLESVVRRSLPKITPVAPAATYVDPVLWAKTVAPFAVPFDRSTAGPSGTSSPIFHVLDAFFGRAAYRSRLGAEMTHLHESHPRHWWEFVDAVSRVSVAGYVRTRGHPPLDAAFHAAIERYAGGSGFLGRHRLKVYGYLELAFKVGRTVTIGGFSGPFRDRTWDEVDTELGNAAAERAIEAPAPTAVGAAVVGAAVVGAAVVGAAVVGAAGQRRVVRSELALRNDDRHGYWIAVDDQVYDVTALRRIHPGGARILEARAGTDASAVFRRIGHNASRRVAELAQRNRVGVLEPMPGGAVFRTWLSALYLVVEMENALRIDNSQPADSITPFELRYLAEVHERFRMNYFDAVTGAIGEALCRSVGLDMRLLVRPDAVRAAVEASRELADDVRAMADAIAAGGTASTRVAARLDARCSMLARADAEFLSDVKLLIYAGVRHMERGGSERELRKFVPGIADVEARYAARVADVLGPDTADAARQ